MPPTLPRNRAGHQRMGGTWGGNHAVPTNLILQEVPRDALSGWYLPETADQWRILLEGTGISPPTSLWLCQEASPAQLADSIGNHLLTPNHAPLYGQTVPGWARKAVGFSNSAHAFFSQADGIGDIQAASHLLLTVTAVVGNPGTIEYVSSLGGQVFIGAAVSGSSLGPIYEMQQNTGSLTVNAMGTQLANVDFRPVLLGLDITNNVQLVQTDQETVTTASIALNNNTLAFLEIGPDNVGDATTQYCVYAALWRGPAAELTAKQRAQLISRLKPTNRGVYGRPVTTDPTSRWFVPANLGEWAALLANSGIPLPAAAWGYQDYAAFGSPFADLVGANPITNNSCTPRMTVPGWSRVGVGNTADGGGEGASTTAIGDIQTESGLHLVLVNVSSLPSVNHDIHGVGLNVGYRGSLMTPARKIALATLDGSASPTGSVTYPIDSVIPIAIRVDRTAGNCDIFTDQEKVSQSPYTAPNGAQTGITIGAASTQAVALQVVYGAFWKGAAAEMTDAQVTRLIGLLRNGTSAGLAVTKDATSGILIPQTWTEWQTVLTGSGLLTNNAPFAVFTCQDTTGSLAESFGGAAASPFGSPQYAKPISGWSSKGVAIDANGANYAFLTNAPNAMQAASTMVLSYTTTTATKGDFLALRGNGTQGTSMAAGTTATPRIVVNDVGNSATGTLDPTTAHRPVLLMHDATNSRAMVYTDKEKVSVAYGSIAGFSLALGCNVGSTQPATSTSSYWAAFQGAPAELTDNQARSLLEALGWTVTW